MKKLLPALLLFALASCKKEQPPVTIPPTTISPVTTQPVTPAQPATISGISPTAGTAGTVVTISGTNFNTSATVSFNGVTAMVQSNTATELKVIAPQSASGSVLVTINNQTVIGPAFTYAIPAIIGISPTTGASGTLVTLTGTNLGTSYSGAQLFFNGVAGSIQSITPTEIKAKVPLTTSGNIMLTVGNQSVTGPVFTYTSVLTSPYTSGDVILKTQAEVDGFVAQNKGRQLQVTGNLVISGTDITSISGLSNITSVFGTITLSACPMLTDVSFLNGITSAGSISIQNLVVSAITMDKLTSPMEYVTVSTCTNLNSLSLKSLTNITGNYITGSINITSCVQLSRIDFSSLVLAANTVSISGTSVSDLSGFSALQTAGSFTLSGNPSLVNLYGLEALTALTLPAVTQVGLGKSKINGLYITGNPKLNSLTGLQNLKTVPVARITSNAALADFCPLKAPIITLSTLPTFVYSSVDAVGDNKINYLPALTLTANSNYATTADALAAVKLCN